MIVSLHMPKAGGSSFKYILENHFKKDFIGDYADFPINQSEEERISNAKKFDRQFRWYKKHLYKWNNVKCIHGHFLPYKYSSLTNDPHVHFITWLRDPIERLASHYYYWQRAYIKGSSGAFHQKVVEEKWSFEKFCFSEEMRNLYSQFLWNFPIENFSFIGIVENFEADCRYFLKNYLGNENIEIPKINVNPEAEKYSIDPMLAKELKDLHSLDYKLYECALSMRENRTND